jgi:hypothetical protein
MSVSANIFDRHPLVRLPLVGAPSGDSEAGIGPAQWTKPRRQMTYSNVQEESSVIFE